MDTERELLLYLKKCLREEKMPKLSENDIIILIRKLEREPKFIMKADGTITSIEPMKNIWIPVNEMLPDEFESVLVCFRTQNGLIAQSIAKRVVYKDGSNRWPGTYDGEALAWMPLPPNYI